MDNLTEREMIFIYCALKTFECRHCNEDKNQCQQQNSKCFVENLALKIEGRISLKKINEYNEGDKL